MKIVPVIDVLNCIAVHAIRGKRKEYQPLKSILCESINPLEVAASLKSLGFPELYLADLDAITGGQPNLSLLKQIADGTGLKMMVDAGVTTLKSIEELLDNGVSKVIIGTETLPRANFLADAISGFGSENVIVSLDLMDGQVLGKFELGSLKNPVALFREFQEFGVFQIIVLDLAKVGSGEGVNLPFLREVLKETKVSIFVGGGVRDIKDLMQLKDIGVSGVLLATALHSGKISPEMLKQARLL